jgi:ATP phosphoribosyltransferase
MITIALTKGRILKETLPLLVRAGLAPAEDPAVSRRLVFPSAVGDVRFMVIRGTDVPTYVRHGAADIGVVGKDILLEHGAQGLYEPLDLGIARCRLMTAGPVGWQPDSSRVRVATKFTSVARRFFAEQGIHASVIKLYGAMELAPMMDLADIIVDIVDTGKTLRANGMEPLQLIADVSSRLVVNKASMRAKHERIQEITRALELAVERSP